MLPAKRARVTAKGGVVRWVQWQAGTARLLPRLNAGRTSGPLFLASRRPAPARTPADGDTWPHTGRARLSYERAEYLFKQAFGGRTLHQLRHSPPGPRPPPPLTPHPGRQPFLSCMRSRLDPFRTPMTVERLDMSSHSTVRWENGPHRLD